MARAFNVRYLFNIQDGLRGLKNIYLSISTASPPLGDYVQVRVSAVLVEDINTILI